MAARFDLAASRELLKLSPARVRDRLDIEHGETHHGASYEGLKDLTQYYNAAAFPGRVYVSGERVEMVYIPHGSALADTTVKELRSALKGKSKSLRSRAGKEFDHMVYPADGVAFSCEDDELRFVEVFPPRPLEAYLDEIYRDPGPFTR